MTHPTTRSLRRSNLSESAELNRRDFLQVVGTASLITSTSSLSASALPTKDETPVEDPGTSSFDLVEQARRNRIVRETLSPDFFEGMLLGNGDVGVVAVVRPDALGLHLGKSDCWDVRVNEDHHQHVLNFEQLKRLWKEASEDAKRQGDPNRLFLEKSYPPFAEYTKKTRSAYARNWPRPWPCGTVWFHWDPRWVTLRSQTLDISSGLLTLVLDIQEFRESARSVTLSCFVSRDVAHVVVFTDGPLPVTSVAYYPEVDTETQLPLAEVHTAPGDSAVSFACFQRLPATEPVAGTTDVPETAADSSFALSAVLQGQWAEPVENRPLPGTEGKIRPGVVLIPQGSGRIVNPLRFDLTLATPQDHSDNQIQAEQLAWTMSSETVTTLQQKTERAWEDYWLRSGVQFQNRELERIWYHNQYFLACCLKPGHIAPGLFGNWNSGKIGTAWHGDYHMNYNTQQVYWSVFSSNHVEQHLPYIELVERLMPLAEQDARERFGLPGASFPHSAYPVPCRVNPYPVPPWGYEICETPWTVQSLWWHYRYTLDETVLQRVYPLMRGAARFIAAYVQLESDGTYHIAPTVAPESWGFTVDWRLNRNCILDLALSEFLLDAVVEASEILNVDVTERIRWTEIRQKLAAYPRDTGDHGEVWLEVLNAPVDTVCTHPVTLAPVFPAEQVGLGRREDQLLIARTTASTIRPEGCTDLVIQPLARARLGILSLDWFRKEVAYCLLPNGTAGCRVRQTGARYRDSTSFDFLMQAGIWIENFSLPAVLNECLMQSYTGVIRLFPNTDGLGPAEFHHLRAMGAFLVSAAWDGLQVTSLRILSEKGAQLRLVNPWKGADMEIRTLSNRATVTFVAREDDVIICETLPGKCYELLRK